MTPVLVVLPYCEKDSGLAATLLVWMGELSRLAGGPTGPAILLAADRAVPSTRRLELATLARQSFGFVKTALVKTEPEGWLPNQMFLSASNTVKQLYRLPFLWLEPDCVPLVPFWLDSITEAYENCPKKFMGPIIKQDKDPTLPKVHLTGCAVYPNDAFDWFNSIPTVVDGKAAWDIAGADRIVAAACDTSLMHHLYGSKDLPPTFVRDRKQTDPAHVLPLSYIPQGTALFHRCKDASLINVLRACTGKPAPEVPATQTMPPDETPEIPAPALPAIVEAPE